LDDHLLGRLGGDTAEVDGRQLVDQEIAQAELRLAHGGLLAGDLHGAVLDLLDHLSEAAQVDLAGAAVDFRPNVVLVAVLGAPGLGNGLLHGLQDLVTFDALLAGNGLGDL
jgi:hypothetical protein